MALCRFGSFAVEWSLIYGARWGPFNPEQPFMEVLGLFVDLPAPGHKVGEPDVFVSEDMDIAWAMFSKDDRFRIIDRMAIDVSRLLAVSDGGGQKNATVTLSLSTGIATLILERSIASGLLQTISTSPKP